MGDNALSLMVFGNPVTPFPTLDAVWDTPFPAELATFLIGFNGFGIVNSSRYVISVSHTFLFHLGELGFGIGHEGGVSIFESCTFKSCIASFAPSIKAPEFLSVIDGSNSCGERFEI